MLGSSGEGKEKRVRCFEYAATAQEVDIAGGW
jgi:hypothetical protein